MGTNLYASLDGYHPGDVIEIVVERDGKEQAFSVTLEAMPPDGAMNQVAAAAEAGQAWAMVEMGLRYSGRIQGPSLIDADKTEAVRWFQKAADAGSLNGMLLLGQFYGLGEGVAENVKEAERIFNLLRQSAIRDSNRWLQTEAEVLLAQIYSEGLGGVPKNEAKAVEYYLAAAELQHLSAVHDLATMYERGVGVPKDMNKAVALYQKAAELGHGGSQFQIGRLIYEGKLATRNLNDAKRWLELAAYNDIPEAMFALGLMAELGEGGPATMLRRSNGIARRPRAVTLIRGDR